MAIDASAEAKFRLTRILAVAILVGAPIIYLVVAFLARTESLREIEVGDWVFYMLLVVAMVTPAMYYPVERLHLAGRRKQTAERQSAAEVYVSLSIIRFALTEAAHIFGLVTFLLTGSIERMLWLYAVGVIWSVVHWPRRGRFETFLKEGTAIS